MSKYETEYTASARDFLVSNKPEDHTLLGEKSMKYTLRNINKRLMVRSRIS